MGRSRHDDLRQYQGGSQIVTTQIWQQYLLGGGRRQVGGQERGKRPEETGIEGLLL
jgi:hypothetical protein